MAGSEQSAIRDNAEVASAPPVGPGVFTDDEPAETQSGVSDASEEAQNVHPAKPEGGETSALQLSSEQSSNNDKGDTSQLATNLDPASTIEMKASNECQDPNRDSTRNEDSSKQITPQHAAREGRTVQADTNASFEPSRDGLAQAELNARLRSAAKEGEVEVVEKLLDEKANARAQNESGADGWTPLQNAVMSDEESSINVLVSILNKSETEVIAHMSVAGETALIQALKGSKLEKAAAILNRPNGMETARLADADGRTALHWACKRGYAEVTRLLLGNNVPLDARDEDGCTPLHLATSEKGNGDVLKLLLRKKEFRDVANIMDNDKRTALFECVRNYEISLVEKLVDAGASVVVEDNNAWTILIYACVHGTEDMVKFLIDKKHVNVNQEPKDGWTALHMAVGNGLLDMTKTLLEKKAKTELTTKDDCETALHVASRYGYAEIVRELLKSGANPQAETRTGQTALQLASEEESDNYRLVTMELLNKIDDENRDVAIAQLATSTDWSTLEPLLKEIPWEHRSNVKEQLTLLCLASDLDPSSHKILRSKLAEKTTSTLPEGHGDWTALHWAAYLGLSDLVLWQLISQPPKAPLKDVISVVPNKRDPKISNLNKENAQGRDYQTTLDWLRNPPLMLVGTIEKRPFKITDDARSNCTDDFYATITDFYKRGGKGKRDGKVGFLSRVRTVESVIYKKTRAPKPELTNQKVNKSTSGRAEKSIGKSQVSSPNNEEEDPTGPQGIMEAALNKLNALKAHKDALKQSQLLGRKADSSFGAAEQFEYTEEDLCFRWIHLPANNLEWMKDATRRVYRDKGTGNQDDERLLPDIIQTSWRELRGIKPELRWLRPACVKESTQRPSNQGRAQAPQLQKSVYTDEDREESLFQNGGGNTIMTAQQSAKPTTSAHQSGDAKDESGHRGVQKVSDVEASKTYHRVALYMPYLTLGTHTPTCADQKMTKADKRDKTLFEKYGKAILHRTRTLDEFYYDSLLDTRERDGDQVVGRYVKRRKQEKQKREKNNQKREKNDGKGEQSNQRYILRVDQLWLWVIDDETIITSSTNRIDTEEDLFVENIHEYLLGKKGKESTPTSVDEMAKFITSFCIEFIDRSIVTYDDEELSTPRIFAETINGAADREKKLFEKFRDKVTMKLENLTKEKGHGKETPVDPDKAKASISSLWSLGHSSKGAPSTISGLTGQEREYESIRNATDLLIETKDILDELNMLRCLLTQQQSVWEQLHDISNTSECEYRQWDDEAKEVHLRKPVEKWKSAMDAIRGIEEMEKNAQRIQDAVNSLVELEQNDASISEAEEARKLSEETMKQGKTLMAFTVVTIVFLPLSFLTSLFAVNISVFPHKGDDLFYTPEYIFPLIFGTTTIIAAIVVSWAFKVKLLGHLSDLLRKMDIAKAKSKKQIENVDGPPVEEPKKKTAGARSGFGVLRRRTTRERNRKIDEESKMEGHGRGGFDD